MLLWGRRCNRLILPISTSLIANTRGFLLKFFIGNSIWNIFCLNVDPNYDPCPHCPCSCPHPHPSSCLLREEVNMALAIPEIIAVWLGNSCCCPPLNSQRWLCGQTAPWPGDMFALVFVTISQIGVGPVPLHPKSGLAGRSGTHGSTTQVCMAQIPLQRDPDQLSSLTLSM